MHRCMQEMDVVFRRTGLGVQRGLGVRSTGLGVQRGLSVQQEMDVVFRQMGRVSDRYAVCVQH